jgi:hypothetical protein
MITTEPVQKLTLMRPRSSKTGGLSTFACIWVGPTPKDLEQFSLVLKDSDEEPERDHYAQMVQALSIGLASRIPVSIHHDDTSGVPNAITLSLIGPPTFP